MNDDDRAAPHDHEPQQDIPTGFGGLLWSLPSRFLIFGVRLYQIFLSPFLGRWCRFTPSCSNYFIQAVRKHGAVKGSLMGAWRICRCNPLCRGGYDPP